MKKTKQASKETLEAYEAICAKLKAAGAERGSMFGMPVLKEKSKAFAGLFGDAMVFKLAGDAHRKASALTRAELFDPSGMKRPMKAWVVVPSRHRKTWLGLARQALAGIDAS